MGTTKSKNAKITRGSDPVPESRDELKSLFGQINSAKLELESTLDCLNDIIILVDKNRNIRRCNRLLSKLTGKDYEHILGNDWRLTLEKSGFQFLREDDYKGELIHLPTQRRFDLCLYAMNMGEAPELSGHVISLNDTTELRSLTAELQSKSRELTEAQQTVFQQEKLASIGQLAAGVAHEINNPIGFITSNFNTLDKYLDKITEYLKSLEQAVDRHLPDGEKELLHTNRRRLKIDHILNDTKSVIAESLEGTGRVRQIVQDLKSFSRVDNTAFSSVNINDCLETTINVAWNEIKYIAKLHKDFGDIPRVQCFPQQINQVFLNLIINAAQSLEKQGDITIKTWENGEHVCISVTDTGTGIPPEAAKRIFEPFFTTKEPGKGTGLGLSISYDIVHKHGGTLTFSTEAGAGTTFVVMLPIRQN